MIRISDGRYVKEIMGIPVAVDIFRATTNIVAMFISGVTEVIPITNVQEGLKFKEMGYITFGEKNTEKIEEFDFGNSPTVTLSLNLKGKKAVILTTNGTNLIRALGKGTYIGSFLNINSLAKKLRDKDVHIFLAHSKEGVQIEDQEFAYALSKLILEPGSDISVNLERSRRGNGADRLRSHNFQEDIDTSLKVDITEVTPMYDGFKIIG